MPEPCDEPAVYSTRCGESHANRSRELNAWRHRRGLFFELLSPPRGSTASGLGQAVSNALLLHSICRSLQRFCYITMYGLRLDELMRYASGLSWGQPDATERRAYGAVRRVACDDFKPGILYQYGSHAVSVLSRAPFANASLLHVKCYPKLRFVETIGKPRAGYLPVVLAGESTARAAPFLLDPCYCRFLTEPVKPPVARPAHAAVQLRTGYADVPADVLKRQPRHLLRRVR